MISFFFFFCRGEPSGSGDPKAETGAEETEPDYAVPSTLTPASSDISISLSSSQSQAQATGSLPTPVKGTKIERRASGASRFLRSLRSNKEKELTVIALKEIDPSHSLSPEGKRNNPGYNSTAVRKSQEISRSQSFQEKRLLVSTGKTTLLVQNNLSPPPTLNPSLTTPLKGKHSRAQSFVCSNPNSPQFFLRQKQLNYQQNISNNNNSNSHNGNSPAHAIYSVPSRSEVKVPMNVNGLPTTPKCETIYENVQAMRKERPEKVQPQPQQADYMNIEAVRNMKDPLQDEKLGRRLKRSVSAVPSERSPFPKKILEAVSQKAVYSSIGNG